MRKPVIGIIGNLYLINDEYPAHAAGEMNSAAIAEVCGALPLMSRLIPRLWMSMI